MSRAPPRIPGGRRSARLVGLGRVIVHGIPVLESEEEIVVVPVPRVEPEVDPDFHAETEEGRQPVESVELDRQPDPVSSEEEQSVGEGRVMVSNTRLRYSKFRGDRSKDVDEWMGEFEATSYANQEDQAS